MWGGENACLGTRVAGHRHLHVARNGGTNEDVGSLGMNESSNLGCAIVDNLTGLHISQLLNYQQLKKTTLTPPAVG